MLKDHGKTLFHRVQLSTATIVKIATIYYYAALIRWIYTQQAFDEDRFAGPLLPRITRFSEKGKTKSSPFRISTPARLRLRFLTAIKLLNSLISG
ncbi:MAG: hypothetical protein M0R69_05835 [Candidatus Cloacimonetes bacterium]|nr:hypothetical protein [Candidatus Cloacimonadota bacterium]